MVVQTSNKNKITRYWFSHQVWTQWSCDRDQLRKEKGKEYADQKLNATSADVDVGDNVQLKQNKTDKLSTTFETDLYKVVDKIRSQLTVESPEGVQYKCYVEHTKKYIADKPTAEHNETLTIL